ncbi:MAG TPA: Ger(x)C family spore germination protein [Terriglobales bacterium]|nr:Ger(x)C family spore germination protein [Terriglobales bacterium]
MRRKAALAIVPLLFSLLLCGCWDYRSMDELNIVAGLAVDAREHGEGFTVTFELVDVSTMKEGSGSKSVYVTAEGPTVFEAVRNAKKKLYNKMYFGNTRAIIISREVAEKVGVRDLVTGFLRNPEPRETLSLIVSLEEKASDLITSAGADQRIISYDMAQIIGEDKQVSATSKQVLLYQAYNLIETPGKELVLPAFHLTENEGADTVELDGLAIFKGDKLAGFLSPDETRYFLLATDDRIGGPISFPYSDDPASQEVSVTIYRCKNRPQVTYRDGKVSIEVEVNLEVGIVELRGQELGEGDGRQALEGRMKEVVERRMREVFEKVQRSPGADIYGYGNMLYMDDHALWEKIGGNWDNLFQNAEFTANVEVVITHAGLMSK